MYEHEREQIAALRRKVADIAGKAQREARGLTELEKSLVASMNAEAEKIERDLPAEEARTRQISHSADRPYQSFGEQLLSVMRAAIPGNQIDPRLYQVRSPSGLSEAVPSDGGFLVQQDFSSELLLSAYATGILSQRCRRQPISGNANGIVINGIDEISRVAGSRWGGIVSFWMSEADEKTPSKPKFRRIELKLKKLIGLCYATDELLTDASALESVIRGGFRSEFGYRVDDAILNGTGAGQPMGVLNSGSLITVDKEAGQKAGTIVAENVLKMVKRTLGLTSNYVWLYSKSILDQIYSLSLAIGTGGIPLFLAAGSLPNQPENRLMGLPMIELEQCPVLGTVGDLVLADLSNGYILADKGDIATDVSIHVRFIYDESVFRFVLRTDGQPVLAKAITPASGSASYTQSHMIALQSRL